MKAAGCAGWWKRPTSVAARSSTSAASGPLPQARSFCEIAEMADARQLNAWSEPEAYAALRRCCGSSRWTKAMVSRRPFADDADLVAAAAEVWRNLARADWLEAFA